MDKPRICIIQPRLNTLSETFIKAHAERLPADVTVVHGRNIPYLGERPVLSQSLLKRGQRKLKRLVKRQPWSWEREITLGYIEAFRRIRAQAVLAEYGMTGVRVMDACRLAGIPLIVHFHGYDASKHLVMNDYRDSYPRLFREAAGIITVSNAMYKKLLSLGADSNRLHLNVYGVDCKKIRTTRPGENSLILLSVGRFVEKKAPYLTLLAFNQILRQFPEARLRMIGDGPLLGVCRDLASSLQIQNSVDFLGAQDHETVVEEMQRARLFVQHSIEASDGDCEGTPNSILEAGASGLPVVSTKHAGIPDVVVDGETGFLGDEKNVDSMAQRIGELLSNPQLADEMGERARLRIEKYFTMNQNIQRLWSVIEAAIEGRAIEPLQLPIVQQTVPANH